ncbi:sunset domain-containing protein [Arthrobacter psychrolactophilus]|uniref:sunset domain-containing protein n=1 Tax=Arthrobacter psychrolactophilus TaxID=92442 RepID=UPI0026C57DD9
MVGLNICPTAVSTPKESPWIFPCTRQLGAFYLKTTPEICFSTETEAKNAGYRKSKV